MITSLQDIIILLQKFWSNKGCLISQPLDMEIGAATFHPLTFFKSIGPNPWYVAYIQPVRRPNDGRMAKNTNRFQHYYQFQVILKPSLIYTQEYYIDSLKILGINPEIHDIQFIEDNWESPTLGAYGIGWEIRCNGMEISQYTYFQQMGGLDCKPISCELTYGIERIAFLILEKHDIFDIPWYINRNHTITYGDMYSRYEHEMSIYNFNYTNIDYLINKFDFYEKETKNLIELNLLFPAYESIVKSSHIFNLLDARRYFSTTERQRYILRIQNLSKTIAKNYYNNNFKA